MSALGNKKVLASNLDYYMRERNVSRDDLCTALGFKYTTVCDWINAKTYPRIDKIEMMADFFGISKTDLIEKKEPDLKKEDGQIEEFTQLFAQLTDDQQKMVVAQIKGILSNQ